MLSHGYGKGSLHPFLWPFDLAAWSVASILDRRGKELGGPQSCLESLQMHCKSLRPRGSLRGPLSAVYLAVCLAIGPLGREPGADFFLLLGRHRPLFGPPAGTSPALRLVGRVAIAIDSGSSRPHPSASSQPLDVQIRARPCSPLKYLYNRPAGSRYSLEAVSWGLDTPAQANEKPGKPPFTNQAAMWHGRGHWVPSLWDKPRRKRG
ncbi:hypothetical protein GQ53DRAFT_514078 [Thozetella sp. PMI_491]|nr:hypothetical protein GQ53DRAFT_514078 [Thozetella sp. PMI_491]